MHLLRQIGRGRDPYREERQQDEEGVGDEGEEANAVRRGGRWCGNERAVPGAGVGHEDSTGAAAAEAAGGVAGGGPPITFPASHQAPQASARPG